MPAGLKASSSTVAIGFEVNETAANTFTQSSVDLNLSPLDREVFVVQSINMDASPPDALAGTNTITYAQLTTTSQTGVVTLSNSNCLAVARLDIKAAGFADSGCAFSRESSESPATGLEYIGIIATNDFFIAVKGTDNVVTKGLSGKLYGYRAVASADIYAALVQSEVLSA
jgi:hypothetical protein